jgi:glucokinase
MKNTIGIGIDIGGTFIKYGIVDAKGKAYWETKRPTQAQTSQQQIIQNIITSAKEALTQAKSLGLNSKSIGIGTPGLVDKNGMILGGADNLIDWVQVPLKAIVEEAIGLPTSLANDADMMAMGEYSQSKTKAATVIFITLGTGIGGAMIINGQLFQGHFGLGGELGVFPMLLEGKVQNWEDIAATSAMVKRYQSRCYDEELKGKVNGEYIIQKYLEGEGLAKEIIEESTNYIAMGIAGYVNIFNPQRIIIGGGISDAGDFFIEKIKEKVKLYAFEPCLKGVQISAATLGNRAGFIGAGVLGLERAIGG